MNDGTSTRFDYLKKQPGIVQAMMALEKHLASSGLDPRLVRLVKLRASQINGCAFCIEMHDQEARRAGEDPRRLALLPAHRDAGIYQVQEQVALAWTEALTTLGPHGVPEALYRQAREHFAEADLANLTLAVVAINGWNRLNVAFRLAPA